MEMRKRAVRRERAAATDRGRWDEAAARLVTQRRSLAPIEALPEPLRPRDEAEGYALQQAAQRVLEAAGLGPVVGHKIGCTTAVMQAFLGIPNPCGGTIHAAGVLRSGARVPRSRFVRLGVECEIAVALGRDLVPGDAPVDGESAAAAVRAVMPAIEIVDDRYRDYRTLGVPTLVADDFFHSGCVLGEPIADWRALDLAALAGATFIDGAEAGRGTGASVMGHPLAALAWLANARPAFGLEPLREGQFVLLGSLVQTVWVEARMQARIEIERLGTLELGVDP
ncbi:MAG TPA: fumarylacetoacetate hydrolase family protein [Albitalea sp.]